jgi:hypothetical protein
VSIVAGAMAMLLYFVKTEGHKVKALLTGTNFTTICQDFCHFRVTFGKMT